MGIGIGGEEIRDKARTEWNEGASDGRSSVLEGKRVRPLGMLLLRRLLLLPPLVEGGMKASRLRLIVESIIRDDNRR